MSVRIKTLTIIGLTFLIAVVILFLASRWFVFQDANIADRESVTDDSTRLLGALDNEIAQIDSTNSDWAMWDDTYAFVNGDEPGYIQSNLNDNSTFTNIGVELMLFINNSGQTVYGKMVDLESGKDIQMPQSLLAELKTGKGLLAHKDPGDKLSGILLLPEGPLIISSQPILTSQGNGPIRGTLIMGRRLDQTEIAKISQTIQLSINVFNYQAAQNPVDVAQAKTLLAGAGSEFIRPQSESIISGYSLIEDVFGKPALILRVNDPRDAYRQAKTTILYLGLALLAIGLILGLMTILLIEKLVITRLTRLNQNVMKIARQGQASSHVESSGNDEIAMLANSVNSMLDSLEHSMEKERESEERYRGLTNISPVGIFRTDKNGTNTYVNPMMGKITGLSYEEAMGEGWLKVVHPEDKERISSGWQAAIRQQSPSYTDYRIIRPDGTIAWVLGQAIPEINAENQVVGYVGTITDITERVRAEAAQQQSEFLFRTLFELSPDSIVLIDPNDPNVSWPIVDCNEAACRMNGYRREELIGQSIDILNTHPETQAGRAAYMEQLKTAGGLNFESDHRRKDGTIFPIEVSTKLINSGGRELVFGIDRDITLRKQAEAALTQQAEELRRSNTELDRLYRISVSLLSGASLHPKELAQTIVEVVQREFDQSHCSLLIIPRNSNELHRMAVTGPQAERVTFFNMNVDEAGLVTRAVRTKQTVNVGDVHSDPDYVQGWEAARAELAIPLKVGNNVIGVIDVQSPQPEAFSPDDERLISIFAERAAMVLEHSRLNAQTEQSMQQLLALRTIDAAISSSFDVRITLGVLLDQVTRLLGIHAADILSFSQATQSFRFVRERGFRMEPMNNMQIKYGAGYAWSLVRDRRRIVVPDLRGEADGLQRSPDLSGEGFVAYVGLPLIAKGQVKGILEIFQREPLQLDQDGYAFLDMLVGQAAIAIDNSELFENLQSTNDELGMAYDTTLEGWASALELRDKETEGHTRRVAELSMQLARLMGVREKDILQIYRGALLHDIGKMGIPDSIMLKPGPLTDDEWTIMRMHPRYAFDMLSPIAYLHQALDIPYCHHEKWDGTGYPRGLKGSQIPLPARIFAVADVWDALTSDRPYRKAWQKEDAIRYIQEQSGKHFDPEIAAAFLKLIQ